MPITPLHTVRRISQDEFQELSYAVMGQVFQIHNEFGRFFDERIYKRGLACRIPGIEWEFPITVSHGTFSTTYLLDALVGDGAAFEFKVAEVLTPHHRGQLYNYLLLLDLAHGKLINMRPDCVHHEFINATLRPADRHAFEVISDRWNRSLDCSHFFSEALVELLHDWGTGLQIAMYENALTHFLGGEEKVVRRVSVRGEGQILGDQLMCFAADDVVFRLTAFESAVNDFEDHARRLLRHVDLRAILWVNIGLRRVTFATIE